MTNANYVSIRHYSHPKEEFGIAIMETSDGTLRFWGRGEEDALRFASMPELLVYLEYEGIDTGYLRFQKEYQVIWEDPAKEQA